MNNGDDRAKISVRPALAADVPAILGFIRGLAEYERLAHFVEATEERLLDTMFGPQPFAEALLGFVGDAPVGFALYFHNYSTFLAKPGIYLEDLFVLPEHRGKGLGRLLISSVARIAVERQCGRFVWSVLDWNEPAIEFYKSLGAEMKGDWRTMGMTGSALEKLASSAG